MKRALLVAALALAGCNSILGVGDFRTGDGGVGDDVIDAMIAPDADPSSVTGTSMLGHVAFDGTVETVPEDLSVYTIKAYVPNGDGTFMILDGVGRADGTFEIRDVPVGPYYLYLLYAEVPNHAPPTPKFWVTDERHLDLGYQVMGRADAVEAVQASPVILNLTNMAPWGDDDVLLVDSYNNGSEFYGFSGQVTNPPSSADTATTGLSFDWRDGYTYHPVGSLPRLIDATAGDDLFVTHLHDEKVFNGLTSYVISRQVGVFKGDVTQTDGSPVTVDGAFTPVVLDQSESITIDLASYRAYFDTERRGASDSFTTGRLDNAGSQHVARIGSGPWSVAFGQVFGSMRGVPEVIDLPAVSYGESSLFPSTWGKSVLATYTYRRRVAAPGAAASSMTDRLDSYEPLAGSVFLSPGLRPVSSISVGGVAALGDGGAVTYDGTHGVTVTWEDVAAAQQYEVYVFRLYEDGGGTLRQQILRITTPDSSVVLPPDLLEAGQTYNLAVGTIKGIDAVGLRRFQSPITTTIRNTNAFLFTAACGDGVPDTAAGEECDTAGASATCDADCSLPVCGDTTLNVAAGETCDHGANTFGCDVDCTAVECGDGRWNRIAEDCDDGNLVDDGNGCSADCVRVGTCGDGTVQDFFEECDSPDIATCTLDCRLQ